jgi:glycosyltransferase involved in cell wall biosynthesis
MLDRRDEKEIAVMYSIIVATYNRVQFLSKCLDSLCALSTTLPFEVVVVDDGSVDETPNVVQLYRSMFPAIFRYVHQEHRQLAAAKNMGIKSARGSILLFIDDDAIVPPDFLDRLDGVFRAGNNVDVVGFIDLPLAHDPYFGKGLRYLENFSRRFLKWKPETRMKGHIAVKRSVLQRSGLFDESKGYRRAEDTEMNYRLSKVGSKMIFSHKLVVYHKCHSLLHHLKQSWLIARGSNMLDLPNAFWYYRVPLGLAVILMLSGLFATAKLELALWIVAAGLFMLLVFSEIVSFVSARTLYFGPAIFILAIARLFFLVIFSIRYLIAYFTKVSNIHSRLDTRLNELTRVSGPSTSPLGFETVN